MSSEGAPLPLEVAPAHIPRMRICHRIKGEQRVYLLIGKVLQFADVGRERHCWNRCRW